MAPAGLTPLISLQDQEAFQGPSPTSQSPPNPPPPAYPIHTPPHPQSFSGCVWRSRSDDITTVARATGTDKSG